MASPLDSAAKAAVKAMGSIGANQSVTLRRTTSTYDASTGKQTPSTTDYTWTVVVGGYAEGMADGTTIKQGDRRVIGAAASLSVTPDPKTDKLIISGNTYTIVPGGLRQDEAGATWEIQVRR